MYFHQTFFQLCFYKTKKSKPDVTKIYFANKNFPFTKQHWPLIAETAKHGRSHLKVFLEIDDNEK